MDTLWYKCKKTKQLKTVYNSDTAYITLELDMDWIHPWIG